MKKLYEITSQILKEQKVGLADTHFIGSATAFPAFKISAQKSSFLCC
jgi:hypothetical protein